MNLLTRLTTLFLTGTFLTVPLFVQAQIPPADFLIDLSQDGVIDSKDLLILLRNWGLQGIVTPIPTNTSRPPPTETSTPSSTQTPTSTETPISTETLTFTTTETSTETPTPPPTETPTNPDSITVNLPSIRMVRIPAGSFLMGSTDTERSRESNEGPVHQVTIDYDFYMGETEVTQSQWEAVMGYNAATHSSDGTPWPITYGVGNNYPVYFVSWDDCQAFLAALNALGQRTFRLPTEAEWEYACRAGATTRFYFGDSLGCDDSCENCLAAKGVILPPFRSAFMWYCGNSEGSTHPVRQKFANVFGLYDMHGNMWEWCQDWYHSDYSGAPIDGSAWESPVDGGRIVRGGSWFSNAQYCRSTARGNSTPDTRYLEFGFRLVRDP